MISAKKLVKMARKWRKLAVLGRNRISYPRNDKDIASTDAGCDHASSIVYKGHFVVYSDDHQRFVIPLTFLSNNVFRELWKMSEEEFGLPTDGPITLPCDTLFMNYIISVIRNGISRELERALLMSLSSSRCSSSSSFSHDEWRNEQSLVY